MAINVFQDLLHLFTRLGVKPQEARIYLACLRHPAGLFTHEIVEQTSLNRSTANLMIDRLIGQGYLAKAKRGGRYQFFATPPQNLLMRQEALIGDFRDLLPLLSRLGPTTQEMEVRFFEGPAGIHQMWEICLNELMIAEGEGRELLNISSGQDVVRVFPTIERDFITHRVKAGIPIRIIAPSDAAASSAYDVSAKQLRDARYFDKKTYPFNIDINIYGQCVSIGSPSAPIGGMIMKNDRIAKSMRTLFNMLWLFLD